MNAVIDWQARETAIDVSRSFSVVAPAGSGKTELLTQRLLALLATVDNPEEVLAITFTRKAAEEMTERLLKAMQNASLSTTKPLKPHEAKTRQLATNVLLRDKQRGWQLLQNPHRLRLKTIDGLCASITQQLPLEARFGADVAVADEPNELYAEATRQLLNELKDSSSTADDLAIVLNLLDNRLDAFEELMCGLLAKRDQWLSWMVSAQRDNDHHAFVASLEANIDTLNQERLTFAATLLAPFASELCMLLDYAATHVNDHPLTSFRGIVELPQCQSDDLHLWKVLVEQLLTKEGKFKKKVDKRQGFPAPKEALTAEDKEIFTQRKSAFTELLSELSRVPGLAESLARIKELVPPDIDSAQSESIEALMNILPRSVAHLWMVFSQRGVVDYIEINRAANNALGDEELPTDLALKLDYQIRHILVDEFQDTSPPQMSLLEKLTTGWQQGDGRTLFIVGDGMQSCYGFREANVGIFLSACERGIGNIPLEPLQLQVNFRSQQGIIDWVNQSFKTAFPAKNDINAGAVSFSEAVALNEELPDPATYCYAIDDAGKGALEAQRVVEIITSIRRQSESDSIAILVRGRRHLVDILPALKSAGISWLAEDIDPLTSRSSIRDLVNLYAAIHNPSDHIAWAALLRSPMVGLTLQDMLVLSHSKIDIGACIISGEWQQLPISSDGGLRLNVLADIMCRAYSDRARFSPRQSLHRVWTSLKGPQIVACEGLSVVKDVERFMSCLDNLQASQSAARPLSVERIENALKKLYASADSSQSNAVKVMTIHKSKGLEFDHVIIPGLGRLPKSQDKALVQWRKFIFNDGSEGFFMAPLYKSKQDEGLYHLLSAEKKRREQLESTRLLYVGVTRAIKRLYLLGQVAQNEKGECKPPSESSLLSKIWPSFESQMEWIPATSTKPDDTNDRQALRASIKATNQRVPVQLLPKTTTSQWQPGSGATNIPVYSADSYQQSLGNVVHRALELMTYTGLQRWLKIDNKQGVIKNFIEGIDIADPILNQVLAAAIEHLDRVAVDKKNHWIFSAPEARCEWRLIDEEGRLNIIDRTIWNEQGEIVIIDYKTSSPSPEQSIEEFIAQESEQYRRQLQNYRRLLEQLGFTVTQAGLYFTALSRWQPLL